MTAETAAAGLWEHADQCIGEYFGLAYVNYLVLPRTLLQSMPDDWQHQLTALLRQLDDAFDHVPKADRYIVRPAEEHEVGSLTPAQMAATGITSEEGPCRKAHDHDTDHGTCQPGDAVYTDASGREMPGWERVLVPLGRDPVPPYDRGRAYIEPGLDPDPETRDA